MGTPAWPPHSPGSAPLNEPPHPLQGWSRCTSLGLGNDDPQRARLHPRSGDSGLHLLGSWSPCSAPHHPGVLLPGTTLSPLRRSGPLHPWCLCLELNKSAFGFSPSSVCVSSSVGRKRGRGQNRTWGAITPSPDLPTSSPSPLPAP